MAPTSKERYERFMKTMDTLEEAGEKLKLLHIHFLPYLRLLREEGKNLEYIAVGTQAVEFILSKLVVALQHAINISLYQTEVNSGSEIGLEVEIPLREETLGQLVKVISKHKLFIEIDKEGVLLGEIAKLVKERNQCVHNLIDTYKGKVEDANTYLDGYVKRVPIESLIEKMIDLQAKISDDQQHRNKWAKAKCV